jgi:hypothetical protein
LAFTAQFNVREGDYVTLDMFQMPVGEQHFVGDEVASFSP